MKMARPRPRNEARIGASSRRGASDMIRSVVIPLSGHPHPIVLGERCLRVFRRCSRVMMLCVMMGQSLQRSNGFALAQHRAGAARHTAHRGARADRETREAGRTARARRGMRGAIYRTGPRGNDGPVIVYGDVVLSPRSFAPSSRVSRTGHRRSGTGGCGPTPQDSQRSRREGKLLNRKLIGEHEHRDIK